MTATLAPNTGCTISNFFTPVAAGSRVATLTITDSTPGSPHTVMLVGVGVVAPDFTISASPFTATVTEGQSTSYAVTLTPVGGFTGTISLSCAVAPNLATCTVPPTVALNGASPTMVTANVTTKAHSLEVIS